MRALCLLGLWLAGCTEVPDDDVGDDDGAAAAVDGDSVYRYPGEGGRPAFTNRRELVPAAARDRVEVVDLSKVSTNRELGRDLDDALDRELDRLAESRPCRDALADVRAGRWAILWRDQRHLVVVAAMLAALLLVTPWAVRRLGAPWLRVLAFAIPALLLTGILAHAMIEVNRSMAADGRLAELCDPAVPGAAGGARARVEHADRLRSAVEAALEGRDARIEQELAH